MATCVCANIKKRHDGRLDYTILCVLKHFAHQFLMSEEMSIFKNTKYKKKKSLMPKKFYQRKYYFCMFRKMALQNFLYFAFC
jgi:hypothetical protein